MSGPKARTGIAARYLAYWGLSFPPFGPDWAPQRFFLTSTAEEALARAEFAVTRGYAAVLISGLAGVGKSWFLRWMIDQWRSPRAMGFYLSTLGRSRELWLTELAMQLGVIQPPGSPVRLWREISQRILAACLSDQPCVLAVDDVSSAEPSLISMLWALAQLTARGRHPTLVLAGRSESTFSGREPFADWIDMRIVLEPWSEEEVLRFLCYRIQSAGREPKDVFTKDAMENISRLTGGIPRHVNRLAEWCLVAAAGADVRPIDGELVEEVYDEFYRHLDTEWQISQSALVSS
ncbi:AAA family ATPase [Thermogutta sp.]|uniref:ExeA family protein n=1 Tax=Thermogutta sp. TaxID=1962930 RepID=UPI00321FC425